MVHPKVKVPAIVGIIITVILAVLSALTSVPALAPYVSIGLTIVTTISGYLTPSGTQLKPAKTAQHRAKHRA